ncbi:MAG: alpha/beta fold hydrolase [Aestuariibacter sp.]
MPEKTFSLRNIDLSALTFGNPEGYPVLCLHGWLDNAASFQPLAPFLEEFQLLALDLPGHGHSGHRSLGAHYHLLDNITDLHELVELLGWEEFYILGHSLGGILGSIYAACFPEKVKKLVAIEAFGGLTEEPKSSAEQLRKSVISRLSRAEKATRHPSSVDTAVAARIMAGKMHESSARLLMQRNIQDHQGTLRWRTDPRLRTVSPLRLTEPQANAFIESIQCPWLTLLGDKGFEKLKINLQRRKHSVQQFHYAECEGGHHVHMDNPEPVACAVRDFLHA